MSEGKRRSKGASFNVYVGTTFRHEVFCEIEAMAQGHRLANAQVVREIFLRGLAAYHRDGKLSDTAEPNHHDSGATVSQFVEERAA